MPIVSMLTRVLSSFLKGFGPETLQEAVLLGDVTVQVTVQDNCFISNCTIIGRILRRG